MILKNKEYSLEEFQEICKKCESYRELAISLGYSANSGGNTLNRLKTIIKENNIDISHFNGQGHQKNKGVRRTPIEDYLTNKTKINSHKLRIRLIEEGYFKSRCNKCGLESWLNNPIPLELHHKDGNKLNNALNNLELLCPNCHYFTETYKSKNRSV